MSTSECHCHCHPQLLDDHFLRESDLLSLHFARGQHRMAKLFDYQPFKALYLLYFASSFVFVKAPFWSIRFIVPANRPRKTWSLKRAMIVRALQELFSMRVTPRSKLRDHLAAEIPDSQLVDSKFVWIPPLPNDLFSGELRRVAEITGVQPTKIAGFWILKNGSSQSWTGPKAKPGEKTILHMHGGAFYVRTPKPSRTFSHY